MIDLTPRYATTYLDEFPFGGSKPQRFLVEGVGECLVKFQQNPQGPRLLVNEFIGYSLAEVLGVAHPEIGLVQVDAALLPDGGKLKVYNEDAEVFMFEAGLHFYSRLLSPVDRPSPSDLEGLATQNANALAGVVVLDLLLNHWDRKLGNPNLILHREQNMQRLKVVDFGFAFGNADWFLGNLIDATLPPLSARLPYSADISSYLKAIKPERDFKPFLERLETLDNERLNAIVTSVPAAWQTTAEERAALLNYLSERVRAIPEYLRQRREKDVWWQ
jgi:hypothetical protein